MPLSDRERAVGAREAVAGQGTEPSTSAIGQLFERQIIADEIRKILTGRTVGSPALSASTTPR